MSKENEFKGFSKVEDEIFKFENPGDFVQGVYSSRETSGNFDNEVYKIRQADGKIKVVFATTVLQSQMQNIEIGEEIAIKFTGTKPNPKKNLNPIKLFDVYKKD